MQFVPLNKRSKKAQREFYAQKDVYKRQVIYSLIETAKENDLDPYRYLVWLLHNAPGLSRTDEALSLIHI